VQAFMSEMEFELYKLGVPVKTRHNEVAPSQFESAPIFEEINVAVDHNQITMETLRKVARRHGFEVILHEKPFAGVNGSGKHSNWSLSISSPDAELNGANLLDPGKTPSQNLRFLLFLVSILKGVHMHGGLLRAGIASAGNDHRLGANEAPPAIISAFLGDLLSKILDKIEAGASLENPKETMIQLGVSRIPEIMKDNTDRNRTSPFAFTGNKFEFRAVGSSASPALPVTFLNAAVADGLEKVTESLKSKIAAKKTLEVAAIETIRETVVATKAIRFEGNGYSEEWVKEAAARGLPNLRKTPEALAQMTSPGSKEMLARLGVFSDAEITSREHVQVERYIKNITIEADTLKSMVDTQILPACFSFYGAIASQVASAKTAGIAQIPQTELLTRLGSGIAAAQAKRLKLDQALQKAEGAPGDHERAKILSLDVASAMLDLRMSCDELEGWVADDHWPLPKYREMLFLG
jgi:glutamine synthetase